MASDSSVIGSSVVPFRLVFLMWAAFYLEFIARATTKSIWYNAPYSSWSYRHIHCSADPWRHSSSDIEYNTHAVPGGSFVFLLQTDRWTSILSCIFLDEYSCLVICTSRESYWRQRRGLCAGVFSDFFWIVKA